VLIQMRPPNWPDETGLTFQDRVVRLVLLWLAGIGMRVTILAVPPVVPLIHADLRLSETEVGILTGLPSVLFALAAVPGSLLIARTSALRTAVVGLTITGIGSALRGASPDVVVLYATTVATGFGVAIMQPALPPLARQWVPERVAFATAVYSNGLLIGEILPVTFTIPFVLPLLHGSWRLDFAFWGAPIVAIALVVALLAPSTAREATAEGTPAWWPDWRDPLTWRLGLMLGAITSMYFSTNAFLPDYLTHSGRSDLVSPALTALNLGQLPASFLLIAIAQRLERRGWPYVVIGALAFVALLGIGLGHGFWIVAAAALLGFSAGGGFVLMLALPPLLSAPGDVHRVSAAMFTISYTCAVIVPIISGAIWDLTQAPAMAFAPIAACALALAFLAHGIRFRRAEKTQ
jgi:CP family cyanate transporter-like MFS transporter